MTEAAPGTEEHKAAVLAGVRPHEFDTPPMGRPLWMLFVRGDEAAACLRRGVMSPDVPYPRHISANRCRERPEVASTDRST